MTDTPETTCPYCDEDVLSVAYFQGVASERARTQPRIDALEAELDEMREALQRIYLWSEAYPTEVFPEPDFQRAAVLLSAGGMSLDVVSASNMRHATKGVGKIALAALKGEGA